jgi:hypothetical protein
LPPRKSQSQEIPPDFSPEKAHSVLSAQLEKLMLLKGRRYQESQAEEKTWYELTEKMIARSFGSDSQNKKNFQWCWMAVKQQAPMYRESREPSREQGNFEARLQRYEGVLRNCLEELALDMPAVGIKGVYEPGEEYEFYRDVKVCLSLASKEIFVIDPYLNAEIFDVYATAIPRTVLFRLLSANVASDVNTLARKYATGGNFTLRTSSSIHDRVIFADNRVWVCGQSLKDAAKKKPTYIVEHDERLMRSVYENIWSAATSVS